MKRIWLLLVGLASLALLPMGATAAAGPTVLVWGTVFSAPTSSTLTVPTQVSLPGPVAQVASSNSTDYALLTDGEVWAWGIGSESELGDGSTANSFTTPVQVQFPAGVEIAALATDAMPYNAALAIDTTGHAWGWGNNLTSALCQGSGAPSQYLTPVEIPLPDVTLVAGASGHAIFDSAGSLYACGLYQDGSLGDGKSSGTAYAPVAVVGMQDQQVTALVASSVDSGALLADGAYYDWGSNAEGQLGDGGTASSSTPVLVSLPLAVTEVSQGGSATTNGSTLVELSDGSYRAWGDDQYCELGDGRTTTEASPVVITPPAGGSYALFAMSGATSYGVTAAGAVYSWGVQFSPPQLEQGVAGSRRYEHGSTT